MTALAVSAMMTLAMPFASFAASRSCQTGFRLGNNCGYTTGTNAISMVRTQGGCVISNVNAIGLYTLSGKGYPSWGTGNNCGTSCANGFNWRQLLFPEQNCGLNSCTGGNCLTSGNVSMIPGASCEVYQCTIGHFLLFSMTSFNKIGL